MPRSEVYRVHWACERILPEENVEVKDAMSSTKTREKTCKEKVNGESREEQEDGEVIEEKE